MPEETATAATTTEPTPQPTPEVPFIIHEEPGMPISDLDETAPRERAGAPEAAPHARESREQQAPPAQRQQQEPDPLAAVAAEYGLNVSDPKQRAAAERILQAVPQFQDDGDLVTDFERQLAEMDGAAPNYQQMVEQTQQQPLSPEVMPPPGYGDGFDDWTGPADAYRALDAAWQEQTPGQPPDYARIAAIDNAMFARRLSASMPILQHIAQQMAEQYFTRQYGDVLSMASDQRKDMNRDYAIQQLEQNPTARSFMKSLFEEEAGSEPIQFDGESFPNTALNRVIVQNPWILRINRDHPNPDLAERLTWLDRYKAVISQLRKQGESVTPAQAKEILNAGKQMQARESQDRARQQVNAGATATGRGTGRSEDRWVQPDLLKDVPGSLTLQDLLG